MAIDVPIPDRIPMSQKERDVLKILHTVLQGERTQAEAARLLDLSTRQVRRIQRKLQDGGDAALVHGLRGKPSNHRLDEALRQSVLEAYQQRYADFGPTFASEKLAAEGLTVCPQTLRRWLIAAGLWQQRRQRDPHRSRRPRRACFGELVQIDASIHDWLEGRGEEVVLITLIDDATSYLLARFYGSGTVEAHMDLLERWLRRHGRPRALYSDRHSIFEPQDKGQALPDAETQFGRALRELDMALIRAHSPQAKGRVERSFGTAQDRWVKELRLANAGTADQANAVLERLLPAHNRRFAKPARDSADAHRSLGRVFDLAAILSLQEERVVANDYTIRFRNRFYQLHKPVYPGERGGKVIIELRRDGSMAVRFRGKYLRYHEVPVGGSTGGRCPPDPPEFSALAADASAGAEAGRTPKEEAAAPGVQPAGRRSGRTPAEPYPPAGAANDNQKGRGRPADDHPWRKSFKRRK
jgi:transposase-like protein